jgi:hypothetical protein
MRERHDISFYAVWAPLVLSCILAAAAALLVRGAPPDVPGLEVATNEDVVDAVLDLAFPLVGALILIREPRNLFGWAFALVGLCHEASWFAASYATYATFTNPGSLPAARLMSLAQDMLIVPTFLLIVVLVPLLFPTGRPPTSRWWAVGVASGAALVLAVTSMAIRPGPVDEDVPSSGTNPLGIAGAGGVADALELVALSLLALAAFGAFAAVVVRTRRSRGGERRRLKIFFAGVGIVFAVFFLPDEPLGLGGEAAQLALALVGLLALPAAVAIALLGPSGEQRTVRTYVRVE